MQRCTNGSLHSHYQCNAGLPVYDDHISPTISEHKFLIGAGGDFRFPLDDGKDHKRRV